MAIYMWREYSYVPGANTILYMPLKSDLLDHSGNNIQFTQTGTITLDSQGANFGYMSGLTGNSPSIISGDFTFSSWIKPTVIGTNMSLILIGEPYPGRGYRYGSNTVLYPSCIGFTFTAVRDVGSNILSSTLVGGWHNLILTRIGTTCTLYLDNTQILTASGTSTPSTTQIIIGSYGTTQDANINLEGHVNEIIIESAGRTSQEISDYYNNTKANYGL